MAVRATPSSAPLPAWARALADAPAGQRVRGLGTLRSLAIAPDGERVASGGSVGVVLWDVGERRVLARLAGEVAPVVALAFSPDGGRLAALGRGAAVAICDLRRGETEAVIPLGGRVEEGDGLVYSPDGRALLAVGEQTWRIVDGAAQRLDGAGGALGPEDPRVVGFSSRGELVVLAAERVACLGPDLTPSRTIDFAAGEGPARVRGDGRVLVAVPRGARGRLVFLSLETGKILASLRTSDLHGVQPAARAPRAIVHRGARSVLVAYPARPGGAARPLPRGGRVPALERAGLGELSPDGALLAVGDELAGELALHRVDGEGTAITLGRYTPASDGHTALLALDPAGDAGLVVGFIRDGQNSRAWAQIWDLAGDRPGPVLAAAVALSCASVAWLPGEGQVAVPAQGSGVAIADRRSGRIVGALASDVELEHLAVGRGGSLLAGGDVGGGLVLWDRARGEVVATVEGSGWPLGGLAWQPGGDLIATTARDGVLRLWSAAALLAGGGKRPRPALRVKIGGQLGPVAFAADGSRCAVATRRGGACVVDVGDGAILTRIGGDGRAIGALALRPGGGELVTGHTGGRVRVWAPGDGALLGEWLHEQAHGPDEPGATITGLAFAAAGRTLALSHASGALRLWTLPA